MTEIKLRATEARDMAEHIRTRLNSLTDSFTGKAQMAFDDTFNEWKTGADQMLQGLDGLGQFLNTAADTIEQTDQEIANQLSSG